MKKNSIFPDPSKMPNYSDIIATGADISAETLLDAYSQGIFPWYNPGEEILWWCPSERFVLLPEEVRISKSMRKILDKKEFQITVNQDFETVMRECMTAKRSNQNGGSWITDELISSMKILNKLGVAKSVEAWQNGKLVGGFYGLEIGNIFCGESMFAKVSNASKTAFISFVLQNREVQTH